jgi:hypothetical protein
MLTVTRQVYTSNSTIGKMDIDGVFECYTEEPPQPQGVDPVKPYCIPAGTYRGQKYNSPRLGRIVLLLLNVPGFEDIEIHNGNYPRNTHGCTLVGQTCGDDFVGASVAALEALIAKLSDNFEITYVDTEAS